MRITYVRCDRVAVGNAVSNAAISYADMTAGVVVIGLQTDRGEVQGLGFDSIGRFSHAELLRERFLPRLDAAPPTLLENKRGAAAVRAVRDVLMRDEKGGGHGERAGAIGLFETALWDALAKAEQLPLWQLLAREYGHHSASGLAPGETPIYATGGHYPHAESCPRELQGEAERVWEAGYGWFKLKTGGLSQSDDRKRIDSVLNIAPQADSVAVDANAAFASSAAAARLADLDTLGLRWIEEPGPPLDYHLLSQQIACTKTPIATGENLFSLDEFNNLLRFGGVRCGHDILQMDIALSYGIDEYASMLQLAGERNWPRSAFIPHAGHQLALHVCAGLGLGAHETSSAQSGPFAGVADNVQINNGIATLDDTPGVGIEQKPQLYVYFQSLLNA
jgi:D(-)-tartrate dehydratase